MLENYIKNVREKNPLVHNITNYVTVNDVANILLACGASPIMSDEELDVVDITSICNGLNINIGTLNQKTIKSMILAGQRANKLNHIVTFDPVGVSASKLRTDTANELLQKIKFDVIKGNVSEIKALHNSGGKTRGVDASINDIVTVDNLDSMVLFAKDFANKYDCIVAITGKIDLVSDKEKCFVIYNGKEQMSKITGTGCMLSALINAFVCANSFDKLNAVATAVCVMGLAGEIAYSNLKEYEGNSTYRNLIIDSVYNMNEEIFKAGAKYEIK